MLVIQVTENLAEFHVESSSHCISDSFPAAFSEHAIEHVFSY